MTPITHRLKDITIVNNFVAPEKKIKESLLVLFLEYCKNIFDSKKKILKDQTRKINLIELIFMLKNILCLLKDHLNFFLNYFS